MEIPKNFRTVPEKVLYLVYQLATVKLKDITLEGSKDNTIRQAVSNLITKGDIERNKNKALCITPKGLQSYIRIQDAELPNYKFVTSEQVLEVFRANKEPIGTKTLLKVLFSSPATSTKKLRLKSTLRQLVTMKKLVVAWEDWEYRTYVLPDNPLVKQIEKQKLSLEEQELQLRLLKARQYFLLAAITTTRGLYN